MVILRGVKLDRRELLARLQILLGFRPEHCRVFMDRKEGFRQLEVWLGVDDHLFSDEIKELERLVRGIEDDFRQQFGVPAAVRLKELGSFAKMR